MRSEHKRLVFSHDAIRDFEEISPVGTLLISSAKVLELFGYGRDRVSCT